MEAAAPIEAPRAPRLPPGPRGRIVQTVRYMRSPWERTKSLFEQYGDAVFFPSFNGDVVLTRDPEHVRALYTLDATQFEVFGTELFEPVIGRGSMLLLNGEEHRRERKLLTPPFHGARMKAYGRLMCDLARAECERWRVGETFDFHLAVQSVSMRVILRAVFGVADPAEMAELERLVTRFMAKMNPAMLFFPVLQRRFFGLSPFDRFLALRDELDGHLMAQVRARRGQPPSEDILSLMLAARYEDGEAMTDRHVRDELLTLLLAGHETTALGLAWLFDFLTRDASLLQRVRAELDSLGPDPEPEQLAQAPLLEACCYEALRIRPVVNETFRLLRAPLAMGEWQLPSRTLVAASVVGLHFNPRVYPEPERFRPERFLERKHGPFEFLAFGGGVRRCLGAAMAQYEMKMVAATILRHAKLEATTPAPPRAAFRGLTMGPVGGVPLRLAARG